MEEDSSSASEGSRSDAPSVAARDSEDSSDAIDRRTHLGKVSFVH